MQRQGSQLFHLIWILAKTDFSLRYQGSVLGFLWALLKPLALFLVLNVVFSQLFASDVPFYSLQLLTGIFLWNFFAEGTSTGLMCLMNKRHILTKIAFPRWVIVFASSLQALMSFSITVLILLVALLVFRVPLSLWQVGVFLIYCVFVYFIIVAFSFFAAPVFLRFRDLNQIWEVLLLVGFYVAPVIYPFSVLPQWLQPWLYLNPMTFVIRHSKSVLFLGKFSRLDHHLLYSFILFVILILSWFFFRRYERRVIELL